MISILRPSTPPLALISSAASSAACGIDAPAIACASAMTPILIGSAAKAGLEAANNAPAAAAPNALRNALVSALSMLFSPLNQASLSYWGRTIAARESSASKTVFRIVRWGLKSSCANIRLANGYSALRHADFVGGHASVSQVPGCHRAGSARLQQRRIERLK